MELFLIALIAFEVLSGGFVTSAFAGAAAEGAKAAWGETSAGAKRWYGKRAKRMKKTRMGRWRLRTEATVAGGLAFVGRGLAAGAKAAPGGANKGRKARHAIRRKAVARARAGGRQVLTTGGAKVAEWRTRGGRGGGPDGAPSGANGGPVADPSEGDRDTAPVDDQPWWRRPGDPAPDPRVVVSDEVVHKDDPGVWRELEHYGRRESGNPPSRCPDCLGQGCADCDLGAIDGHVIDDLERRAWRDRDFMAAQDLVRIRRADPRLVPTAIEDPEAHANGWTRDEADRARLLQAMVDKAEEGGQEVPGLRADLEGLRMKGAAHRAAQDGERRDDGLTGHSDDAAERDLRRRAAAGDHEAKKLLMLAAVGAVKCGCCGMYHGRAMKPGEHCDWCRGHGHESQTTPPTGGGNDTTTKDAEEHGMGRGSFDAVRDADAAHAARSQMQEIGDAARAGLCPRCGGQAVKGHLLCQACAAEAGFATEEQSSQTTPPSGGGNTTNEGAGMAENRGVRPYLAIWEQAPEGLETTAASVTQRVDTLAAAAEANSVHEVGGIDAVVAAGEHAVEALRAFEEQVRAHQAALNEKWTPDVLAGLDATGAESGQELAGAH